MGDLQVIQSLNAELCAKEKTEFDASIIADYSFSDPGKDYYGKRIVDAAACVLVAVDKTGIVGYLCGSLSRGETYRVLPLVAELENMFVVGEYRSQGVGGSLCESFLSWCKARGVGKVKVSASAQNTGAIRFYKRNGFQEYSLVLEADL